MAIDTLRLLRNILLRAFAIGFVIGVLQVVLALSLWGVWVPLMSAWWHTDEPHLSNDAIVYFTALRFFLLFVLLVPGLALHWTLASESKRRTKTGA